MSHKNHIIDTEKVLSVEQKYKLAKKRINTLEEDILEIGKDNDKLKEWNDLINKELYYTDKANIYFGDRNEGLEERNKELENYRKNEKLGRKILPFTCVLGAIVAGGIGYFIATKTPVKNYIDDWLGSYRAPWHNQVDSE